MILFTYLADLYRTIVTYGEQMLCFCGIMIMVFIKFLSLLRLLLGPLSETLCWLQIFFNQSVSVTTMVVLNAYYLARVSVLRLDNWTNLIFFFIFQYFYAVVYKTTTICNEELIGIFIFIYTILLGLIFAFVHNMSPGKWALNYYICLGENPDKYQIPGGKFPVTAFVAMLTIVVYALTNYNLYKAKKKSNRVLALAEPLVHQSKQPQELKCGRYFPFAKKFFWSVLDLVTLYIVVVMVVTEAIQWNFFQKKLSVMEMKTTPSGHFYYIYHQYIYAQLCLWIVAFNSLVRNADLRKCKNDIDVSQVCSIIDHFKLLQTYSKPFTQDIDVPA